MTKQLLIYEFGETDVRCPPWQNELGGRFRLLI